MSQSILVVENDESIVSMFNAIGSVYGLKIQVEKSFETAKTFFEGNECIIALQEIIIGSKTDACLFDLAKTDGAKNFEVPVAVMNEKVDSGMNKRIRKKVFGIVNKPYNQEQLEKTLKILVAGSQIIKMGRALGQMKFTEQIMAIEGITEVVVKLSTIATGFLKEDRPFESKAANAGINEFMMIVSMEDELKPESAKMVKDLEESVRTLYALLEAGPIEPLSSWMTPEIFTFYSTEDIKVAGQEEEPEEAEESTELTPEQIDAMMNGGGAPAPAEEEPAPEGNLTQEQIEALMNGG